MSEPVRNAPSAGRPRAARRDPAVPGLAVVIVSHNTQDHLAQCLATIEADAPGTVVVVDNASTDGSAEMVRREFPRVVVVANTRNVGYGAAANQGVARTAAPYVLLLNGDTRLARGTSRAICEYLDANPAVAVVGPRLVHPDGRLQASTYPFPSLGALLLGTTPAGRVLAIAPGLRRHHWRRWPHDRPRAAPWVLGAALGIRRSAFDGVGGFDPGFFMYCEDTDLCYRLQAAGWQVHYAPLGPVTHVGGASSGGARAAMRVRMFASLERFYRLHYPPWTRGLLRVLVCALALGRLVLDGAAFCLTRTPEGRARLGEELGASWQLVRGGRCGEPQCDERAARLAS